MAGADWVFENRTRYRNIEVFFDTDLNGGGNTFGQDYLFQVQKLFPTRKPDRVYEWCSGPGFIGFSLLATGMCSSLCLADVNPKAVAACRQTIDHNRLADRVSLYLSDGLSQIPAAEKWDLVVGNPPHSKTDQVFDWGPTLIYQDIGWALHRAFYRDVGKFLAPGGTVLIQENGDLSRVEDFADMIAAGGLTLVASWPSVRAKPFYYVQAVKRS